MSSDALRVLVIAQKENNTSLEEKDLTFLGFVGMIDPAKEGVKETIEIAHNAGIDVVMITGDNKITAFAIAKELNICNDINQCMSGQEIDEIDDETFRKNILNYRVFARVSPEHKVKIVQAFKSHNKICSMTGKSRCPVMQ
jgi:Ca2+-transporting ATPase